MDLLLLLLLLLYTLYSDLRYGRSKKLTFMYRSIYYAVDNLPHDKKTDTRNKTHLVYIIQSLQTFIYIKIFLFYVFINFQDSSIKNFLPMILFKIIYCKVISKYIYLDMTL